MNAGKKGASRRSPGQKKLYRRPKLTVHGDIRALTRTKKGTSYDGSGKPRTKTTGTNA